VSAETITEPVLVKIGGKERTLRYTFFAVRQIKHKLGVDLLNPPTDEDGNPSISFGIDELITYVWAGLLHAEPDLTDDDLAKQIDLNGESMACVNQALNEAFGKFWGVPEEGAQANTRPTVVKEMNG